MKKATCILYEKAAAQNLIHGKDWGFCAFVHDEWQILSRPENVNFVAEQPPLRYKRPPSTLNCYALLQVNTELETTGLSVIDPNLIFSYHHS